MKPSGRLEPPPWASDTAVHTLFGALGAAGITARFVGGWVRDAVRGVTLTNEPDLAVDKPPETVMLALKASRIKVVPTGLKHGTVTAVIAGAPYELTTLRRDVETDGRHAVVAFTDDWLEDASRRDFTFNALYADLDGTLYDPFEGRADLAAKHVRFIGDADQRIAEDKLRILRFFRFHAWLGRPPFDAAGFMACRRNAGGLRGLSGERVRKEFLRLLDAPAPSDTVDAMREAAILDHWLPECDGAARLRALIAREDKPDPLRRFASILSREADATVIGKRLRLSTQESLRLEVMLDSDPVIDVAGGPKAWRAQIYDLGGNLYADRLLLATEAPGDWRGALAMARGWTPPELPVSGGDALKLGLKPGPKVGGLIETVERWWIDGDFTADRAACLAELERLVRAAS
ncbi:CCA tRNA nucleotidyltransferase [Reyranella sp. MMS21-HV4-11]|uniref:CCA tRNA nucleotidyltransferase n=1 Tax=Reyranella humidisoli TaxID=2849149 RepID=A0ABS6IHX1_9HYPH|nr:CCA tRNA nucleotidyltransferase [Reyranella sp. MMS21-HV4-11]MBU8872850.1 CCA tRNA nucleotidyltransferase [Reyranella sp. MMS21-HV4-11]